MPQGFKISYIVPIPKPKDFISKSLSYDDFRGIAISPIISKTFEYCFWTNSSHYSPHQLISLVSKRTQVTLFERLLIAMSHEVQLLTSERLIYLRLLIKLTIMPYLSN